jgi:GH24 family phage-related lysozyme (muramidase)
VAAFAIILAGGIGLYFLARAQGVDVGSLVNDLTDEIKSGADSVSADLGLSNDPLAIAMPIIQGFESFSERAYPDPPGSGKFSIAWGHQIQPGEAYDQTSVIGRAEGDQLLRTDMGRFYACVTQNVSVELTPNQTAALISFCYNVGCSAFANSTLLSLVNQGDFEGAAAQFPQWVHSGGAISDALVSRRAQEQELFNS